MSSKFVERAKIAATLLVAPILAVAVLEGLSSLALVARAIRRTPRAEAAHIERDTLLGWINKANLSLPDLYALGVGITTDVHRFRRVGPAGDTTIAGRAPLVCSGGSFTLGYGVNDAETWCALLGTLDPALAPVNMGQGGYGLDQDYLWYLRDGMSLKPAVHIFAFVGWEFHRMQSDRFQGEPKPQLERSGDSVRAIGVPVPSPDMGPALLKLRNAAQSLRSVVLLQSLVGSRPTGVGSRGRDSSTWEVARAALRDLARRDSLAGTKLIVVFLPMREDHTGTGNDLWRAWAQAAAASGDFTLVDLIEPFRRLPVDSIDPLFLTEDAMPFPAAAGHYTAAGNAWVARQLLPWVSPTPATGAMPRR